MDDSALLNPQALPFLASGGLVIIDPAMVAKQTTSAAAYAYKALEFNLFLPTNERDRIPKSELLNKPTLLNVNVER